MIIIDCKDLIVGRFATKVAKLALLGEDVSLINCNYAVIVGLPKRVIQKYKRIDDMGHSIKGPFLMKTPDRFVKRIIRGMLPYKKPRGRDAFARIKCYNTVPVQFKDKKTLTLKEANLEKITHNKFITINEVCKALK